MNHRSTRQPGSLLVVLLVALATGGATWAEEDPRERIETRRYRFEEAGKEMVYTLFVPRSYNEKRGAPLLVALHGLWSNPQHIIRYPGLVALAEKHGYIVVAPMGYNARGWYGSRGPKSRGSIKNLGELSEKDVMNVLAIVRKEYAVDSKRIYLLGHSMGGAGTLHLGIKYPKLWAGLAPIAPAIELKDRKVERLRHIPVIMVHGERDLLVPVRVARSWAKRMRELELDVEYVEVERGGHLAVAWETLPRVFEFFEKRAEARAAVAREPTGVR